MITTLYFPNRPNFYIHTGGWGSALPTDIAVLLDNALSHFYEHLDPELLPEMSVHIKHERFKLQSENQPSTDDSPTDHEIFLDVTGRYWASYVYQFAYELCHHVIGDRLNNPVGNFGWFEESLCELASLYILIRMADTPPSQTPYLPQASYRADLKSYANAIVSEPVIRGQFWDWLDDNITSLQKNRYLRDPNKVIAVRLLPLFLADPELWKTIQYLRNAKIDKEMPLTAFLEKWEVCLPEILRPKLNEIRIRLTGTTSALPRHSLIVSNLMFRPGQSDMEWDFISNKT